MEESTSSSTNRDYKLKLNVQKENVFVTQLHEREDQEDIRKFPIVKENADKLLLSGINTLQSTSLLRQAVEVEHVDHELEEKREEFRKRMEVCKHKEEDIRRKRLKITERASKFEKFLRENEAKRNRALKKYQQEVKENEAKSQELARLNLELEQLRSHKEHLIKRLEKYKIYESYLTRVSDSLPENYLEMSGDSVIQGLIQRHEGLSATNKALVNRSHMIQTSLEKGQKELDDLRQDFSKQKLIFNSELASLQDEKEKIVERNGIREQRESMDHQKHRSLLEKLSQVVTGIDNLAYHSHRRHWPALAKMNYTQKLSMIKEYIEERMGVEKMIKNMIAEGENASDSGQTSSVYAKSNASVIADTAEPTFPRKHKVLPPITRGNRNAAGNFLERLTAITEV